MSEARIAVRDARDLATIEQRPLASYCSAGCSYGLLLEAAARYPAKPALKFFIDGECHDPRRIPLRARLRSVAAYLRQTNGVKRFGERYVARQGMQLGRDGRVFMRIDEDGIRLGGRAVTCVEGNLKT